LLVLLGCSAPKGDSLWISSFEADEDLDKITWQCRTWFERSREQATHGKFSLLAELSPSETYPGITVSNGDLNWTGYDHLEFDVFNPGDAKRFHVRIDDKKDPGPDDWFWEHVLLQPGANHIQLDLHQMKTYGTKRWIKLSHVERIILYTTHLETQYKVFLDNLRVTRSGRS
jgi:hypothetical protein